MSTNIIKLHYVLFAIVMFFSFLLITPLHNFSPWISPDLHKGYYSILQMDVSQDTGYYVYLRSTFFDHDLDFSDEIFYFHRNEILPNGYTFNHWSPGINILWFPFFLIGHGIALLYEFLGFPVTPDGNSFIYHTFLGLGSLVYAYLFLLLCYETLNKYFSPIISFVTTLTIFFSTNIIYYTFIRSRMAHPGELFLAALVIFTWLSINDKKLFYIKYILLGILIGVLTMTRHNSIVMIAVPLLEISFLMYQEFRKKQLIYRKYLFYFLCLSLSFFISICPNLITLKVINGTFLPLLKNMESSGVTNFYATLFDYNFIAQFFDYKRGIVFWEPIWILSFLGLIFFAKVNKKIGVILLILSLVVFFFGGSTNLVEMRNDAYGNRYHTIITVFLAFGYAHLISKWKSKQGILFWSAVSMIFVILQYFILIQYKILIPYDDPQFSVKFVQNIPLILHERQDLLIRSSSFLNIFINHEMKLVNFLDVFMLIVIPISLMLMLTCAGFGFALIRRLVCQIKTLSTLYCLMGFLLGLSMLLSIILYIQNPPKTEIQIFNSYIKAAERIVSSRLPEQQDNAILLLKKAEQINKKNFEIYSLLGESYFHKNKITEAIINLEKSLLLDQNNNRANFVLGAILLKKGDYGKAISHFNKVISVDKTNWAAYANIGTAYYYSGQQTNADISFKEATRLNPNFNKDRIENFR